MATFKTNAYSSRYLAVDLTVASQSSATNSSKVNWRLYGAGGSTSDWIVSGNFKLVVGGTTRYASATRINLKNGTTVASGSFTVTHANDGKKSLSVSLQAAIYTNAVNCTGSGTFTLPTINRGTTFKSFNLTTRGLNFQSLSWQTAQATNAQHYSLNGGAWVSFGDKNTSSANETIKGLKPNTTYKLKIRVRRNNTQIWTTSAEKTFATYPVATLSNIKDVTIGDTSSTFTLTNQSGYDWSLVLETENGTLLKELPNIQGNGSYTVDTPTANELYQLTPNSNELVLYYKVSVTQNNEVITARYPVNFLVTNSNPTFSDFDFKDTNPKSVNLLGDNQIFIKGISIPNISVNTLQQMKTINYANPSNYQITFDNQIKSVNNPDTFSEDLSEPTQEGLQTISVKAIDTRGNATNVNKQVSVLPYEAPIVYLEAERLNGYEATVSMKVHGSFDILKVDDQAKNTIKTALFYYREEVNEEWGAWQTGTNLNPVIDFENGTFSCGEVNTVLDNKKRFQIKVTVSDELSSAEVITTIDEGVPLFFVSESNKAIGVNCIPPYDAEHGSIWSNGEDIMSVVKEQQAEILYLKDVVDRLSYDTGWIDLYPNTSNLENQTAYGQSRIRRIGDVVTLFLSVKPTTNLDLSTNYNLFLLPEEFRPSSAFMSAGATVLGSGSLQNTDITINKGGQVTIRMSGTQTSKVAPSANIAGTITWFVN